MPRTIQGKSWCITWHTTAEGYTTAAVARAHEVLADQDVTEYAVFGRETCPTTGRLHYQGYVRFKSNKRFNWVRQLFPGANILLARGSPSENRGYCIKDGHFREWGTLPQGRQGRRSDVEDLVQWGREFYQEFNRYPNASEFAHLQPAWYLRFPRALNLFRELDPIPQLRVGEMREGWQQELEQELEDPAHDRKIIFYVDPVGGAGKTWFQQNYMTTHEDGQVLSVAKRDDIAHTIDPLKRVFFFNVPRTQMEFISYSILEQMKDRMVFSPKYDSRMKYMQFCPHVVVFSNEHPDETKLTEDRFDIRELS